MPGAQNGSDPRWRSGCLKLHVLIANTNDDATIRDVQYRHRIDGLDAPATSVKVGHWRVDSSRSETSNPRLRRRLSGVRSSLVTR